MTNDDTKEQHRVDKWLWHARFYRTRSLATAAINGGKVRLNAERIKPGHRVRIGDRPPKRSRTFSRPLRVQNAARDCASNNAWQGSRDRAPRDGPTSAIGAA